MPFDITAVAKVAMWLAIVSIVSTLGYCVVDGIKEQGRNEIEKELIDGEHDAAEKMAKARKEFIKLLNEPDPAASGNTNNGADGLERLLDTGRF